LRDCRLTIAVSRAAGHSNRQLSMSQSSMGRRHGKWPTRGISVPVLRAIVRREEGPIMGLIKVSGSSRRGFLMALSSAASGPRLLAQRVASAGEKGDRRIAPVGRHRSTRRRSRPPLYGAKRTMASCGRERSMTGKLRCGNTASRSRQRANSSASGSTCGLPPSTQAGKLTSGWQKPGRESLTAC